MVAGGLVIRMKINGLSSLMVDILDDMSELSVYYGHSQWE